MGSRKSEKIIAVADASFIIGLRLIEQWYLLPQIVATLYVPPAVWEEVVERGSNRPGAAEVQQAAFIKRCPVGNNQAVEMLKAFLDAGEAEAVVLAQEIAGAVLLVDEARARRVAQRAGIRTIGVAGFLLTAKQRGLISEVRPLLEMLLERNFRLSPVIVKRVLQEAGEE